MSRLLPSFSLITVNFFILSISVAALWGGWIYYKFSFHPKETQTSIRFSQGSINTELHRPFRYRLVYKKNKDSTLQIHFSPNKNCIMGALSQRFVYVPTGFKIVQAGPAKIEEMETIENGYTVTFNSCERIDAIQVVGPFFVENQGFVSLDLTITDELSPPPLKTVFEIVAVHSLRSVSWPQDPFVGSPAPKTDNEDRVFEWAPGARTLAVKMNGFDPLKNIKASNRTFIFGTMIGVLASIFSTALFNILSFGLVGKKSKPSKATP